MGIEGRKALASAYKRQDRQRQERFKTGYTSQGAPTPARARAQFQKDVENISSSNDAAARNLFPDFETVGTETKSDDSV
jgi:hypothetical protein